MKGFAGFLWKLTQIASVGLFFVLLIAGGVLAASGKLQATRLKAALEAYRGKTAEVPVAPKGSLEEEWRKVEEARADMERSHRKREEELKKLQDLGQMNLAQLQIERERLEAARAAAEKAESAAKKEIGELQKQKIDSVTEANLPIYQTMKGQELASIMLKWDEKEPVRYLRLFSPKKATEVLRAMQQDVAYTTVGQDAPKGAQPRFDQIVAELQRVP